MVRPPAAALLLAALCSRLVIGFPETDLRSLLLNERNQEVIDHLGTSYEIVYPHQIRKDWARGLSTALFTANGTTVHVPETTFLIETFEHKLQLDLELNTKLFPSTLVQLLYFKDASPVTEHKLPENCFYHARVRSYPNAKAAFRTCDGIRGVIHLKEKIFFILPLHGNHTGKQPHFLYHVFPKDGIHCGNEPHNSEEEQDDSEEHIRQRSKYIEMALVLDQSLFQNFESPASEVLSSAIEIVNYVDLLYRPLDTAVSLVYVELWIEDQMTVDSNASVTLERFRDYAARRISRISVDATHMLVGTLLSNGIAFEDSICTGNAVGLTRVDHRFQPHVAAFVLSHMLGHNLGMGHDNPGCECPDEGGCLMGDGLPVLSSTDFSSCSVQNYQRTLSRGYGACLYNMPTMRMSICGNSILEENEECDCGTAEECASANPCCDPLTCRLIKHAQCSSGQCCKKCKLLSPDHLCRPSRGECDIPEFCDGLSGECPEDVFKRNGAVCSEGDGYCYQGTCPVLKRQCEHLWGQGAEPADSICFESLNVRGTPTGNCGTDARGEIAKCAEQHSYCGILQCNDGENLVERPSTQFVVHKIATQGSVHKCKAKKFSTTDLVNGLVKDGTKCGYQKVCIKRTCTSLKSLVSGRCPSLEVQAPCSGHGICTNVNSCFCDGGWKGSDCTEVDESAGQESLLYYDPLGGGFTHKETRDGESDMRLSPNLAITVIAASVVIGVGLVVVVILIFFYRQT